MLMDELPTIVYALGGAAIGGYIGVKVGLAELKVGFKWMKEKLDEHVKDREIHHTHYRGTDATGAWPRKGA